MKAYRIKHTLSGLYYQPAKGYIKSNLGKNGKVYLTRTNPLTSREDYIYIQVDKESKVFEIVKGLFPLNKDGDIIFKAPKEQFEIEELK